MFPDRFAHGDSVVPPMINAFPGEVEMKSMINHLISAFVILLTIVTSVVISASRNLNAEVPWGPGSPSVFMVTGLVPTSTESSWIRHLPELTSGNSAESDTVEFPYVNLKLEPPAGFRIAERFHGLQSEENNDYIMINTSPSPFATATSNLVPEARREFTKQ